MGIVAFSDGLGREFYGESEPRPSLIWQQAVNLGHRVRLPGRLDSAHIWAVDRVMHMTARVVAAVRLRAAQELGRVYSYGAVKLTNDGFVSIGGKVLFAGGPLRTHLMCGGRASLRIGPGSAFNYGVRIMAKRGVSIGSGCHVGSRTLIIDETSELSAPIVIEDDVWIAHGVTILPGVRVGRGSAIAAGSVVSSDVPPNSLAAGRPARSLRLSAVER